MKHFWNVCITPHPCHSLFCWRLLPIWPKLDFWVKNGAYGLCQLGWQNNGAKLYFSWPYMKVSMIWNNSELSAFHLIHATAIIVVDRCQFGSSWMFGRTWSLWPVPTWLAVQRSKSVFLLTLIGRINGMKQFRNVCITPQQYHSHCFCWLLPIWP